MLLITVIDQKLKSSEQLMFHGNHTISYTSIDNTIFQLLRENTLQHLRTTGNHLKKSNFKDIGQKLIYSMPSEDSLNYIKTSY